MVTNKYLSKYRRQIYIGRKRERSGGVMNHHLHGKTRACHGEKAWQMAAWSHKPYIDKMTVEGGGVT